jgi:hypothetical protein
MFPMTKPEDLALQVRRQHDELRERQARERLARAARQAEPARPVVAAPLAPNVGVAHRFWAGLQHIVHPHPTTHGTHGA